MVGESKESVDEKRAESRRIQLIGKRSYSVSLPKEWVIGNNLKQHDIVYLNTSQNNEIIVSSGSSISENKQTLTVKSESIGNIAEFIIFCYIKGIDKLTITTKKFDHETIKKVRKVLLDLDGYEITDQSDDKIEISFSFNEVIVDVNKIIPRMCHLLKFMIVTLANKDFESLEQTEASLDRLYYLATKILFEALRNHKSRIANKIYNYEDIFYMKNITKRLESIGDSIYGLQNLKVNKYTVDKITELLEFCESILITKKHENADIRNILKSIKIKNEHNSTAHILARIYKLCSDLIEDVSSLEFNKTFFSKK